MNRLQTREIVKRPTAAVLAGLGFIGLVTACGGNDARLEAAQKQSIDILHETEDSIINGGTVKVLPGVLVTDGEVQPRLSPTKLDTNNAAFISGNERGGKVKVAMMRPIIVKNENKAHDNDPTYWATSWGPEGFTSIGLNNETLEHMTYYTKAHSDVRICDGNIEGLTKTNVSIDLNRSINGLTMDAGGYTVPVGQIVTEHDESKGNQVSKFVADLQSQGYQPTEVCSAQ